MLETPENGPGPGYTRDWVASGTRAAHMDEAPTAVGTRSAGSGSGSGRMSIVPSKRVVVDKAGWPPLLARGASRDS